MAGALFSWQVNIGFVRRILARKGGLLFGVGVIVRVNTMYGTKERDVSSADERVAVWITLAGCLQTVGTFHTLAC
jgi:hypothetical protein